jgi:TRAP-type C4-dicarboxylate transport system permease large subunit
MIGLTTPPYGILLFVVNAITGIPYKDIVREVWKFIIALLVVLLLITIYPPFVLWVPRMFGYQG